MTSVRLRSETVVDLVDLSYSEADDESFHDQLLRHMLTIVPGARTSGKYEYRMRDLAEGCSLKVTSPLHILGDDHRGTDSVYAIEKAPPLILEKLFRRTQATTASVQTGLGPAVFESPEWTSMWRPPVVDAIGLSICETSGEGAVVFTGLTATTVLTPRQEALLTKVAMHLGAGHRLRRKRGLGPDHDRLKTAEAILAPNGKVLHVHETAKKKLDQLDDGRRRRDEAKKTKHDAEKALDIWKGLVAGRWSLVDHFDTDGKRFLLAVKNTPRVDRRADLTPRERRVCTLVAMGHRDKEISYLLGLSLGSITASLHRARVKLDVKSRAELVTAWKKR
jgi:DNA-binding CsgD family transcriptional regulator